MNQSKEPEVTIKNTKTEILSAYESLLDKARDLYRKNQKQERELQEQKKLVVSAEQCSPSTIEQNLSGLREQLDEKIAQITAQIRGAFEQLKQVQNAIEIEKNNLDEMYGITKTAHTLDALMLTHQHEKDIFEKEMSEQRAEWGFEKKKISTEIAELRESTKKAWTREQEEYEYQTQRDRKIEESAYASKKREQTQSLTLEQEKMNTEFREREAHLVQRETPVGRSSIKSSGFSRSARRTTSCL